MGMVVVAFFAANADCTPVTTIRSTFKRTKSAASSATRSTLSLRESVIDADILSLNPSKLAQLLPEYVHEDRATGSSAIIQKTYAESLALLLRLGHSPTHRECDNEGDNPRPFRF
jgi:hypothetical protein